MLQQGEWKAMEHIRIRGVMCMASLTDNEEQVVGEFDTAHRFFLSARERHFAHLDYFNECSMGMSDDYPIALRCGSTLVRIGSMIFGSRVY